MKATMRVDGKLRYTMHLELHISREDLIDAVAKYVVTFGSPPRWSRKVVIDKLRMLIREYGMYSLRYWAGDDAMEEATTHCLRKNASVCNKGV